MSATEIEEELKLEYQCKLKLDDITIPDPYSIINDNWINETRWDEVLAYGIISRHI